MNRSELLEQLLSYTIWLDIKGYENYQISICGKVRNSKTKRILRPRIGSHGYYIVNLSKNANTKTFLIHRIVANHFIPNIRNNKFIDHINNNQLDNTISNLRWVSSQQNNFNKSMSSKNTSSVKGVDWYKRYNKWRAQITLNYKIIHIGYFDNINDAKIARQNKSTELYGEFQNTCEK